MSIANGFLSDFMWEKLGNSWDFFVNRNEINAKWDGDLHKIANLYLQTLNVDAGKGLFTVPIEPRTERHLFLFNSDTSTTPNVSGAVAAFSIDDNITTIPVLEDLILTEPTARLFETTDYVVLNGVINFLVSPPPTEKMWAFEFRSNREQIRDNFGLPINFVQPNDLAYLFGTQGMWYALWNGPAVRRVGVGLQILFGLPFARAGTVQKVEGLGTGETDVSVLDPTRGNILISKTIPPYLDSVVTVGEEVLPFSRLSNGIEIIDHVNDKETIELLVIPTRNKFHTWAVLSKAEILQAQVVLSGTLFTFDTATSFIERFKPEYTDWVFGIDLSLEELLDVSVEQLEVDLEADLTSKTNNNYWNFLQFAPFLAENAPFTEDPADPPTATPYPAEQVFHLDDENMKFLDNLTLIEAVDGVTVIQTI